MANLNEPFYRDKNVRLRIDRYCIRLNDDRSTVGHLSLIICPLDLDNPSEKFRRLIGQRGHEAPAVSTSAYFGSE